MALTLEATVQSQASPCRICGKQSDTGTGSSPSTSTFSCHYYSASDPHSSIHRTPKLYNLITEEGMLK
jgi:hypothetical protein